MSSGMGLDVGTSFLVSAFYDSKEVGFKSYRDAFLKIEKNAYAEKMLRQSRASFVQIAEDIYILGEDAVGMASVFGKEVRRPLSKGVISPKERDEAVIILREILKTLLGEPKASDQKVVFSIPADPWDEDFNTVFHQGVFETMISGLGFIPMPLNEGLAVIYSELEAEDFTGIGISMGAGMTNLTLAYLSQPSIAFSIAKAGDYIDKNAATAAGMTTPRAMKVKESEDFDLLKPRNMVEEAIVYYYKHLIKLIAAGIKEKLETVETLPDFGKSVPVVVSGGTSKPKGVLDLVKTELQAVLPFDISEVRHAEDPLKATAKGCLIAANL